MGEEKAENLQAKQTLFWEVGKKGVVIVKFAALLFIFWLLQFAFQYYFVSEGSFEDSAIRASSLGGALLIAISLIIGPLQSLWPKYNYLNFRRSFGVGGFFLIIAHAYSVVMFRFGGNALNAFANLNPLQSALAFGSLAYLLLFPLLLTSTDWAMRKLKFNNWKLLHRTIYFTWILAVLHFLIIRPGQLMNIAGYLLLAATALVFLLQFIAYMVRIRRSRSKFAMLAGISVILFLATWLYFTYPKYLKVLGF
ncbi:MAG: ferric reductase-like transmembrane domain-containing protein [Candidatus Micrarchaeota archaeon]